MTKTRTSQALWLSIPPGLSSAHPGINTPPGTGWRPEGRAVPTAPTRLRLPRHTRFALTAPVPSGRSGLGESEPAEWAAEHVQGHAGSFQSRPGLVGLGRQLSSSTPYFTKRLLTVRNI